jgi:3-phenylpropionate/trans-cinnamate dioxygenase ferredoxin subunit
MDEIVRELVEICPVDELEPGQSRIVDINNRSVGVFNVSGNFFALANLCPHAGGPLCRGQVTGTSVADKPYAVSWQRAGEIVRCPWHSWEFDIATGKTLTDPTRSVRTFKTVVKNGHLYIETGAPR